LNQPTLLQFELKIDKVACGGGHTGIITENGDLFLFGRGRDGQLGRGDEMESTAAYRTEPKIVNAFTKSDSKVIDLALGNNHSLALA
jgi:alpha-tubulin suppressor-like RCC1 family protein